ncbi:DUF7331 family protein [Halopenitus persicus]|uniref:Uncharacterized protein n=1 Tax=Halopenitus persicus TaxID=1048396 RepID=A0A1H3IK33_9EURY|nr:hypothetical protein [Halopenitus persicus]SDY27947.1 hypothetical protein SAMN05216564_104155 [Halopenitus persicus]
MTSTPNADERQRSDGQAAVADVEAYEDGGNVVLFDPDNPLAWVEASNTVRLRDVA